MALSKNLISDFVKATTDDKKTAEETTLYGTIVEYNGSKYVRLDGSDMLTPYTATVAAKAGERVRVSVGKHSATVTGNVSSPAARTGDVEELGQKVDTFDAVVANKATIKDLEVERARVDDLVADNVVIKNQLTADSAEIKDLKADNVDIKGKLTARDAEIENLKANKIDAEVVSANYATIKNLEAANANMRQLTADSANIKDLVAKKANITDLSAVEANVKNLQADKANITDLRASNAKIDVLDGNYANIKTLLSGGAGIGDLQNIRLTSQNAVIDSALIRSAVMQTVSVADLLAGTISTNKFLIASDDGGIRIQGATQQWSDENGTVRMQAGRDAKGNFTFSLFDATGKGILLDATGVKPDAIADGLIVNKMVADNAGIAGSKLDIPSVVSAINDSSQSIKSSRIWFDDQNQSLNQIYNIFNTNVTEIRSTAFSAAGKADAASETASAAADTAKKALDTLSGISTLDALGAALDNDAHVVHTNTDGSGGDYSECCTKMTVYLGDTSVSDHTLFSVTASDGVTGHWDAQSRTYYVTAMTSDSGYVDIDALYGVENKYLTTRSGKRLVTRAGKYILVRYGTHIRKRFSISKAKDGKIGLTYDLHCSTLAVRKQKDGKTLVPASVTFSATENDNGLIRSYSGRYVIQETEDGATYSQKYVSLSPEIQNIYTPSSAEVKAVRCTLQSADGVYELDTQTVIILADAEGLTDDIQNAQKTADKAQSTADNAQNAASNAQDAIVTTNQKVTTIETSVGGLRAELTETTTDLHGLKDKTLLYNVKYHDNGDGTTTLNAVVYKDGTDATKSYPARWFTWYRKTESGESYLGYGYSVTVKNSYYEFGGVTVGNFVTYDTLYLTSRSGKQLITRSGNHITVWKEN